MRWVREELRGGRWVELVIDAAVEQAYVDTREVCEMSGTPADKKAAMEKVLRFHSETLDKLYDQQNL